ncbi:hypothetical protein ACVITL_005020 [Rhizobium pisi]
MDAAMPINHLALLPLKYHRNLVNYLREKEPHVWNWATSANLHQQQPEAITRVERANPAIRRGGR